MKEKQLARAYCMLLEYWQDPTVEPALQTLQTALGNDVDPIPLAYTDGWSVQGSLHR